MNEFLVNTTTAQFQHQPAVTSFLGTHFLVVWSDNSDATVKGQLFQADGRRSGGEFTVSAPQAEYTDRELPSLAGTGSGPVAVWVEHASAPPGPRPHVKMQLFGRDGHKAGSEIQVSTSDADPERRPDVAGTVDGGCLVTWADADPERRIRAQRFGFDGAKTGPEFTASTTRGFHHSPSVITLNEGNFVLAWRSDPAMPGGGALTFRIFDLQGAPTGEEITPDLAGFRGGMAMAPLDNDRFVIAHVRDAGQSGLGVEKSFIEANVFEPDGTFSGTRIPATSAQGLACSSPSLTSLPDGRFLAAWTQRSAETFAVPRSVRAKIFSDSEGSVGQEVRANTTEQGDRFALRASTAFGGAEGLESAFLVWGDSSEAGGDPSDFVVHGRMMRVLAPGELT